MDMDSVIFEEFLLSELRSKLDDLIFAFKKHIDEDLIIITKPGFFACVRNENCKVDLQHKVNTYKGIPVVLINYLPPEQEFIIMTQKDYRRLFNVN